MNIIGTTLNFAVDRLRQGFSGKEKPPVHVGTYERELDVSLERMFENALDWEHLPWQHSSTFSSIKCLNAGDWGWCAEAYLQPKTNLNRMIVELRLDTDAGIWVTKTLDGLGKGTEIHTLATELAPHKIKVKVDFYVPNVPNFLIGMYEKQYTELYAKLYDEDFEMMAGRATELARKTKGKTKELELGLVNELSKKLPFRFVMNEREYVLLKQDGALIAYNPVCPHSLGPLVENGNGELQCRWHGYRFDAATGGCLSGQKLKLKSAPKITVTDEGIVLASL